MGSKGKTLTREYETNERKGKGTKGKEIKIGTRQDSNPGMSIKIGEEGIKGDKNSIKITIKRNENVSCLCVIRLY